MMSPSHLHSYCNDGKNVLGETKSEQKAHLMCFELQIDHLAVDIFILYFAAEAAATADDTCVHVSPQNGKKKKKKLQTPPHNIMM